MASPNSTLPPTTPDDQDDRYNAGRILNEEKLSKTSVDATIDQMESGLAAGVTSENRQGNSKKLNDSEEYAGPNFYRESPGGKKQKITVRSFFKKKGPISAIVAVLLGGGGAFSFLLAPGLGIIQLKEVLLGDLNDQAAALDTRTTAVWKSRLQSIQAGGGICSNMVQIRCKFSTLSNRQVERFKKAGFTLETETNALGRHKIVAGTFFTPDKIPINNPQDLLNEATTKPETRSALNRVFNPIYAGLSDSVSTKVFGKFKTDKSSKITGTTPDEMEKSFLASVDGDELDADGNVRPMVDANGEYLLDENGERVPAGSDDYNRVSNLIKFRNSELAALSSTSTKAVSGVLKGGLKGVSVLGAADSACSVINLGRSVAAAAKVARAVALAQFAMVFFTMSDKILAGDAGPEEVEFVGNIAMQTDNEKTVTNENSASVTTAGSDAENIEATREAAAAGELAIENPDYGKNLFDSAGYSIAAYNDAPTLDSRSMQYMVGGGLAGSLSVVMDNALNMVGGEEGARTTCRFVQSWFVRGVGLAAGVVAGIGSFGASTIISVGASVAVSMAIPFLEAMMSDIVAGNVIGTSTVGIEAGDAAFAGAAALLGTMAASRGLKPLKRTQLASYMEKTEQVNNTYIAQARYEASATPFDVYNQYSFLGTFARSINVPLSKATTSVASLAASVPSLLSASLATVVPNASAAVGFNPDRYTKCKDPAYEKINIAADVFCNVRYGLSPEELDLDANAVIDYMYNNGHVDGDGAAKSDKYKKFVEFCVDRVDGWGESGAEGGDEWNTGYNCVNANDGVLASGASEEELSNFRIFTLDKTITEAMDNEENAAAVADPTTSNDKVALAQKIIAKNKVSYLSGSESPTMESIARGEIDPNAEPCGININILNMIDKITDKHSITISDINRHCQNKSVAGSSNGSRHFAGNGSAIDIAVIDGVATRGRDAVALSVIDIVMPIMSAAATSTGSYSQLGQSNCGAGPTLQPGIRNLEDFCNHLHLDVPPKSDANLKFDPSGW